MRLAVGSVTGSHGNDSDIGGARRTPLGPELAEFRLQLDRPFPVTATARRITSGRLTDRRYTARWKAAPLPLASSAAQQLRHNVRVLRVRKRVAAVVQQQPGDRCRLLGQAGDRAEQDTVQAGPASAPGGQAQQLGPRSGSRLSVPRGPRFGLH
jgi:hypothetical protein